MSGLDLRSASGLRPATAFVLVGCVLTLVAVKAGKIALLDEGQQPRNLTRDPAPAVTFDLVDREGVPLALSVERLELEMSPNAMWQAHTPDAMATKLAAALGPEHAAADLLETMLPGSRGGVIEVDAAAFRMDARQASAVHRWSQTGSLEEGGSGPAVGGLWIRPTDRTGEFTLSWMPARVLSETTRRRHGYARALDWSRRIADDLWTCLHGRDAREALSGDEAVAKAREEVWAALMPSYYRSIVKEVAPEAAMRVDELLKDERVRDHQMRLVRHAKRVYPVQDDVVVNTPVAILGSWRTLPAEQARTRAREELLLPDDEYLTERERHELARRQRVMVFQPSPVSGLELYCDRLLRRPEWRFLERRSEQYTFFANQAPRQPLTRYFQELVPASETPHVVTTLDIGLQRHVRLQLEQVMEQHDPALAMAIALDVESGEVLAVDGLERYATGGFLPTMHTFTPGSTMKVIVMATAIEAGVVDLRERIDSFDGHYHAGRRPITEAEGQKTGELTPAEGLAHSCNAVLVQIGLRIPREFFHAHLAALGYGKHPDAGLGPERRGYLPPLSEWRNPIYTQASVSFGYETSVTLWQHAAALAAVVRGGEWKPLRVVRAVEQHGVVHPVAGTEGRRVFRPETCATVREMMELGAREGTGRRQHDPELVMGTKTGTAQKVPSEPCLHVELEHNVEHGCNGACRKSLVGKRAHKSSRCYTSSMCAWGRLADGGPEAREVMVLVVVEEARGGKRYGADVAGDAAASILKEALGRTRGGVVPVAPDASGFEPLEARAQAAAGGARAVAAGAQPAQPVASDQPWAEDERAPR